MDLGSILGGREIEQSDRERYFAVEPCARGLPFIV